MRDPLYPSLYQFNTRVRMTELARNLSRPGTLDDIPDAKLDRLADLGFDLICWATPSMNAPVMISNPGGFTWMCLPGNATFLN